MAVANIVSETSIYLLNSALTETSDSPYPLKYLLTECKPHTCV